MSKSRFYTTRLTLKALKDRFEYGLVNADYSVICGVAGKAKRYIDVDLLRMTPRFYVEIDAEKTDRLKVTKRRGAFNIAGIIFSALFAVIAAAIFYSFIFLERNAEALFAGLICAAVPLALTAWARFFGKLLWGKLDKFLTENLYCVQKKSDPANKKQSLSKQ